MSVSVQEAAKSRSEAFLRSRGVIVNDALPLIEAPEELSPPPAEDVARRAFVLSYVIGLAYNQQPSKLRSALEQYGLWDAATERERQVLSAKRVKPQDRVDAQWLPEAIQALGWGLGLVKLDHWSQCDHNLANRFPPFSPVDKIVSESRRRPFEDVYLECDLLYRLHWATRHLDDRGASLGLNWQIILERRRAVDWLAGVEPDWDAVPTDT